jgi:hypothetical protein
MRWRCTQAQGSSREADCSTRRLRHGHVQQSSSSQHIAPLFLDIATEAPSQPLLKRHNAPSGPPSGTAAWFGVTGLSQAEGLRLRSNEHKRNQIAVGQSAMRHTSMQGMKRSAQTKSRAVSPKRRQPSARSRRHARRDFAQAHFQCLRPPLHAAIRPSQPTPKHLLGVCHNMLRCAGFGLV